MKQRVLLGHNPCGENVKLVSQLLVMTQLALGGKDLKNTLLFLKKKKKISKPCKQKIGPKNLLYGETIFYYQTELTARLVYYTDIKVKCPITVSGNNGRERGNCRRLYQHLPATLTPSCPPDPDFFHSVSKARFFSRNALPAEGSFKQPPLLSLQSIIYVPIFSGEL